jgi:hypothetical protein
MRIQPRQQLLEIWRAVAKTSYAVKTAEQDAHWVWGGRSQRNSISDAEQLLCLMGPATEIPTFKLDLPNETAEDVHLTLDRLGDAVDIPRKLVKIIDEYLSTYTDDTGTPTFSGGSYFAAKSLDGLQESGLPTPEQRALDVVDSFAVSVRLSLAIIGFARVFRSVLTRAELREEVRAVEVRANRRLTAAMIGLLRGFTVNVFDADSDEDRTLCHMVNQTGLADRRVREQLLQELRDIRAGLRDVTLGIGEMPDLDNENKLFEIGWSWGIVRDAPPVKTEADIPQIGGFAEAAPYLYFTVVALDCIQDLSSERTRLLGLLDEEQQRLARALQIRWDLTQSYWSRIARFGSGRWPLEDMPWSTTDGISSDYLSLLVCSILVQDLTNRPDETSAIRVGRALEELAERARITRRPSGDDPALTMHHPGFPFALVGSDDVGGGPQLTWLLADFSPQLLKQAIRVSSLLRDVERRGEMLELIDDVWENHIRRRQLATGELWDRPAAIYPEIGKTDDSPSWYYTERVIGCLVTAAKLVGSPPLHSPLLADHATHLLAEADHIFDQELMRIAADPGPAMRKTLEKARAALRRAHDVIDSRPGTAAALASQVLIDLDQLDAARHSANGG